MFSAEVKNELLNIKPSKNGKLWREKAFIRNAFLASGSICDPQKAYHLEIVCHDRALADELCKVLKKFELMAKTVKRGNKEIVYFKEGENIADFLNIIGAHNSLLALENVRIYKDMLNNINRVVNCETANLEKTLNASVRQIENIKFIEKTIGLKKLPQKLREIAEIRLEYVDANLKELGEMLTPPLGKSGVNHRLKKLDKIAEDLKNS